MGCTDTTSAVTDLAGRDLDERHLAQVVTARPSACWAGSPSLRCSPWPTSLPVVGRALRSPCTHIRTGCQPPARTVRDFCDGQP